MTGEAVEKNNEELGTEEKKPSRFMRLFTVGLYLFSVSGISIMLALYYIFLWSE